MKIDNLVGLNRGGEFYDGFAMRDGSGNILSAEVERGDGGALVTLGYELAEGGKLSITPGEEWEIAITKGGKTLSMRIERSQADLLFKNARRLHKHSVE